MSEPTDKPAPEETPRLVEEMAAIPYEPLLPIEKKLISWSLILGVVLLVLLAWISNTFLPVETPPPPVPR